MGARERCAAATICTICASIVSRPIFSACMMKAPVVFKVAPATLSPARAVPPTVTPSPGYDRRLQESRGESGTTIYTPAPRPKAKHKKPPPQ